ncbi:hypothetical protein Spock_108 [Bacillus phage Spock]|uniref:Uncharacterized protein n=1 Tax=Bacillus phage Spock TaxID=1406791 RepID=U5Q0V8_9CAUD|nr:hypothetical protein Spock_108 [Bacillus phage Spock]AGY48508.1 hypothetical protein Spock_108 [Bacillus phage Spock]
MGVTLKCREKVVLEFCSDRRTCIGKLTLSGWRSTRIMLDEFYKNLEYYEHVECDDGTVVNEEDIKLIKIIEEL